MRLATPAIVAAVAIAAFALGRVSYSPALSATRTYVPAAMTPATTTFSHFKCYTTQLKPPPSSDDVQLQDQFGTSETNIGAVEYFCTPVTKTPLNFTPLPVPHPANHLICYAITGPSVTTKKPFYNQLQRGTVLQLNPALLCVPTYKKG